MARCRVRFCKNSNDSPPWVGNWLCFCNAFSYSRWSRKSTHGKYMIQHWKFRSTSYSPFISRIGLLMSWRWRSWFRKFIFLAVIIIDCWWKYSSKLEVALSFGRDWGRTASPNIPSKLFHISGNCCSVLGRTQCKKSTLVPISVRKTSKVSRE